MSGMPDYISYYESFRPYCKTQQEVELIEMLATTLDQDKVGQRLGISGRMVRNRFAKIKKRAVTPRQLVKDFDAPLTAPLKLKGTSTLYDAETGAPKISWVKTDIDKEKEAEIVKEYIEGLKEDIKPAKKITRAKTKTNENLLNLYTMTDYHWGMLSWEDETGANWDLQIAEDMMVDSFAYLIENTPPAEVGFFNELGDFEHYDSHVAVTPQHKHILDADGRPTKMIRTAIKAQRRIIEMMAKKYPKVVVLNAEGNHNIISSVWKRELFSELYSKNPDIHVITDVLPYYAYQWGKNMLGFHHGHLKGMTGVADVFIAQYREMYGQTESLSIHMGHKHHKHVKETATAIIEQHQTLAAPDSYAARGGWISQRSMQTITYHKDFFEVGRTLVRPEML